jgi:hypothetical protein
METVFIVRDVEERYLQGIYRHHLDALEAIEDRVEEARGADDGEEELEYLRNQYEIVEMPLE